MKINGDVLGRRRRRKGTYENKQTTHTKIKREKERKRTKTKCIPLFWLVSFLLRFHQLVRRRETIHKMKKKRKKKKVDKHSILDSRKDCQLFCRAAAAIVVRRVIFGTVDTVGRVLRQQQQQQPNRPKAERVREKEKGPAVVVARDKEEVAPVNVISSLKRN
jgi:hypothetical protein